MKVYEPRQAGFDRYFGLTPNKQDKPLDPSLRAPIVPEDDPYIDGIVSTPMSDDDEAFLSQLDVAFRSDSL